MAVDERGHYSTAHGLSTSQADCCNAGAGTHPFRIKDAGGWRLPGHMGQNYSVPPGWLDREIPILKTGGSPEPQRQVPFLPRAEGLRRPPRIYEQSRESSHGSFQAVSYMLHRKDSLPRGPRADLLPGTQAGAREQHAIRAPPGRYEYVGSSGTGTQGALGAPQEAPEAVLAAGRRGRAHARAFPLAEFLL